MGLKENRPITKDPEKLKVQYEKQKQRSLLQAKMQAAAGRDIGEIPPPANPERRESCRESLRLFIETYLLDMFKVNDVFWPWADYHLEIINAIERVAREGGLLVEAVPRGGAKTSLLKAGAMWASFYAWRRWSTIIAATAPIAVDILKAIKITIETNTLMGDPTWTKDSERKYQGDFPEICYPVARLERVANRQAGQTSLGRPTYLTWNSEEIVFADVPGAPAAQGIITTIGFDGSGLRGQAKTLPDGSQRRPDFIMVDDPQTEELARSEFQIANRMKIINGSMLKMGPPGVRIAAMAAVTVIEQGDVADKMLENPAWNGIRIPMLVKWPLHCNKTPGNVPHTDYWERYGSMTLDRKMSDAEAFYTARRCLPECLPVLDKPRNCMSCPKRAECMDADAIVSWKERKEPQDQSPIQHAMNMHIRNPAMFAAEMQQRPLANFMGGTRITPSQMIQKVNGLPQGIVPASATVLTAGVDVQEEILYFCVMAWEPNFTGYVLQYGAYPEQPAKWFKHASPLRSLSAQFPGLNKDGPIAAGLEQLCGVLLRHEFDRAGGGGGKMQLERILVDAGYKPTLIYNPRRKLGSPVIHASRGMPLTAKSKPISAYARRPGWRIGHGWYVPSVRGTREYPYVGYDANFWKTYIHTSLSATPGTPGSISLYGLPQAMADHEHFCDHVAGSEYYTEVFANGRRVCEYQLLPGRPDNDWLDTMVTCAVGASMLGVKAIAEQVATAKVTASGNPAGLAPRRRPKLRQMSDLVTA
jgi:hypothetical protein